MTASHSPKRQAASEADPDASFLADVLEGLSRPHKAIPCKYLYDERGSALFEEICTLEEYYVTRVETALLRDIAEEASALIGPRAEIIEPGAGAGEKIRLLLAALDEPERFVPIDISLEVLERTAAAVAGAFPEIDVHPVHGDFTRMTKLPLPPLRGGGRPVCFFPGSTIGNFAPEEACGLLRLIAGQVGAGGGLLIGVDLIKDRAVLEAAYDDARGVTAAFSKNLLVRINRELGADFRPERFRHIAGFNEKASRIEIHLESLADQNVHLAGREVSFAQGERLHVENSYKYTLSSFARLGEQAGWSPRRSWTDPQAWFSLHYFET